MPDTTADDRPSEPKAAVPAIAVPRGFRNKNPANIEKGADWQGLVDGEDERFCTFQHHRYGIRAIARLLRTYQERYRLYTVRGIIDRWAPPHENNTKAYVQAVAERLGVRPDEPINLFPPVKSQVAQQIATSRLAELIEAIIRHELGAPTLEKLRAGYEQFYSMPVPAGLGPDQWYPRADVLEGIALERA